MNQNSSKKRGFEEYVSLQQPHQLSQLISASLNISTNIKNEKEFNQEIDSQSSNYDLTIEPVFKKSNIGSSYVQLSNSREIDFLKLKNGSQKQTSITSFFKTKETSQNQESKMANPPSPLVIKTFETIDLGKGAILKWCSSFLTKKEAKKLFDHLIEGTWYLNDIALRDRTVKVPRLQAYMSDVEDTSELSLYGRENPPKPWEPEVLKIKAVLEEVLQTKFNFVLLNLYRNGEDHISWHRDREACPEGKNIIASLSLGETRRFLLREKDNNENKKEFLLSSGSLIVMMGKTQHYWEHCVPKQLKIVNPRINLTFRIN